jgi:hypothetical protein
MNSTQKSCDSDLHGGKSELARAVLPKDCYLKSDSACPSSVSSSEWIDNAQRYARGGLLRLLEPS